MALNTPGLQNDILDLITDMEGKEADAKVEFATRLANAIDTFVRSGTVVVEAGIAVATAGSPTAQIGATTAPGTGTIN